MFHSASRQRASYYFNAASTMQNLKPYLGHRDITSAMNSTGGAEEHSTCLLRAVSYNDTLQAVIPYGLTFQVGSQVARWVHEMAGTLCDSMLVLWKNGYQRRLWAPSNFKRRHAVHFVIPGRCWLWPVAYAQTGCGDWLHTEPQTESDNSINKLMFF